MPITIPLGFVRFVATLDVALEFLPRRQSSLSLLLWTNVLMPSSQITCLHRILSRSNLSSKVFSLPFRVKRVSLMLPPWMFVAFWCKRITKEKCRFIKTDALILLGQRNTSSCQCPFRLAYTTVDSYIGKLRSIFNNFGRQGDWNRMFLLGNPATDLKVKQYLKEVTAK